MELMPENQTTVSEAFRSPSSSAALEKNDGLRLAISEGTPIRVERVRQMGWADFIVSLLIPAPTTIQLSGMLNVRLRICPSHVEIDKRKWKPPKPVLARYRLSIPVYDEIGDVPKHLIHVQSRLAFLYPFVPMHIEVSVDDDVVYGQGKFRPNE